MFDKYREGADLTIMNTIYHYPKKMEDGKWDSGSIDIIAKDNVTGRKVLDHIVDPIYPFYFAKDNIDTNLLFIEKDKVSLIEAPYKDLKKTIAELTENLDFYFDNLKNKNAKANNILHMHPRVFWSDAAIEDKYRFLFRDKFQNRSINPTVDFFDIEVDGINIKGDFPEPGEAPVNAVTLINAETKEIFTLLLRNKENPLIAQFEEETRHRALYDELKEFITMKVGGPEKSRKYGLDDFQVKFLFYDEIDEIRLIQDLFILINELQPDFLLAWNMAFDVPYLIARCIQLGYDPRDIMCHPDFPEKVVRYYIDEDHYNEYAERGDKATISSYTVFLDQMIQFASKRKGQKAYPSYKLDAIGEALVNVKKLDYSKITRRIAELPYKDYKVFVFYNIMDTIIQYCIEHKEKDMNYVLASALANNTRYSKIHRQTAYLTNRVAQMAYNYGFIIGNNANKMSSKPTEKFDGAFVGDPLKIGNYSKKTINDIPVMIFDNLDDFDYKSLYPSLIREFNMSPNTQIGKIQMPYKIHNKEGHIPSENFAFNRSREFAEDFTSKDWLEFGSRWLHLATYSELLDDIEEYLTTQIIFVRQYNEQGLRIPVRRYDPNKPVVYAKDCRDINNPRKHIVHRLEKMPDMEDK